MHYKYKILLYIIAQPRYLNYKLLSFEKKMAKGESSPYEDGEGRKRSSKWSGISQSLYEVLIGSYGNEKVLHT